MNTDIKNNRLSIVVPYRNREEHLNVFIPEVSSYLLAKDINFHITFVEQCNQNPFNRGKLLNIGFLQTAENFNYFCFHDIDIIPIDVDYSYPDKPYHIATNIPQFNPLYYSGANLFNKQDFIKINGYSNEYWGWGAEDDDLLNRVLGSGFKLYRRNGMFKTLPHIPNGPNHPNYGSNCAKLNTKYDFTKDGVNTVNYTLLETFKINENSQLIRVEL